MASVADLPAAAAASRGDHPAIIDPDGAVITWSQVERRIAEAAGGLVAAGLAPGDPAGVMLPNGADFAVGYWGVLRAGGTVVPINPAYTSTERDHLLTDSGARWVLTGGEPDLPQGVAPLDPSNLTGELVGSGDVDPASCAVICYTSGTTGRPKGARLSHANLLANLDAFSDLPLLTVRPDDVLLGLLPFFHVFGLNVVLNAAARSGCTVAAIDRFSPTGTAAQMAATNVTVAYGAPPVFAAFAALPGDIELPALRAAVSGADALPLTVFNRFAQRFDLEIVEGYGLTETSPVLASNAAAHAARGGTVGIALPGVDLRLLDPTGQEVAAGQAGEIYARGPNVFEGYHGRPAETAEVLADGWFATGDLGTFDQDGYLAIAGRLKEMIIVSGFNVYPREVEDALAGHPDVVDAAVLGAPDDRTGERVQAAVVLRPGSDATADDLIDHARERLARYKLPRDLRILEALPRLPTGKVARPALRRALDLR